MARLSAVNVREVIISQKQFSSWPTPCVSEDLKFVEHRVQRNGTSFRESQMCRGSFCAQRCLTAMSYSDVLQRCLTATSYSDVLQRRLTAMSYSDVLQRRLTATSYSDVLQRRLTAMFVDRHQSSFTQHSSSTLVKQLLINITS
jgi:hypothetical protein